MHSREYYGSSFVLLDEIITMVDGMVVVVCY
jgi:hypothetical protein